jgi:hypothetical protein
MSRVSQPAAVLFCTFACLAILAVAGAPRAVAAPPGDRFAAIAVSPQTGRYGYGNGYASLYDAERTARANTGDPHAEVVVWVKNGWLALAVCDAGYATSWSTRSAQDAAARALDDCSRNGSPGRIAVWISSR